MELSEVLTLVIAAVGGTLWIVKAIYSVRDAVKDLASELRSDIAKIDNRVKVLENKANPRSYS